MSDEYIRLNYDIAKGDYLRGGEASSSIKRSLMQLGINNNIIKKVCIASYEAEMNVVIHSFGGSITVDIFEDKIVIKVEDRGPGIANIDLAMKEGYSTASDEAREMGFGAGMGLPNMKRSSDIFDIITESGKYTKIHMTIFIK